ncbi:hypothetical protein JXB28_05450 [Candidatus Woesearchaeota archaeon]|nr:hypothetical protein [Candidatus Woesearchaeota archaeon]
MIRKKNLVFIPLALALLMLAGAQASAFTYTTEVLGNTITLIEEANFKVIIENTGDFDDFFTISTSDVNWLLTAKPESGIIKAGESMEFAVSLKPKPFLNEGRTYFIPVTIASEKTKFYYEDVKNFAVYIISPDMKGIVYAPTVTPTISIDKEIDPREKVSVLVRLWNRNPRDLEDLKVVVDGEVFSKEYVTHLLPLEDKMNEILFEIDPKTAPGARDLILELYFQDKKIAESSSQYEITGYADLKEAVAKSRFLCRIEQEFKIVNEGNEEGIAEKKFSINFFERMFTKFTPEAAKEKGDDGKTYYVVRAELSPRQQISISAVANYRPLVIIILLIIAGIIMYYVLRSPLVIIKNADPLGKTSDGLSEIKVSVYLKNRSRKPLANLRVVDLVPHIAEIEKKARLGSMEPIHIGKSGKGTVAKWELPELEPYEERIITYRVKSKLTLVGGINLPSAKARFEASQGKERVTYSNSINLVHGA